MSSTRFLTPSTWASLALTACLAFAPVTRADGTELLGAPSLTLQAANHLAAAGVGTLPNGAGLLDIALPAGAQVRQVLVYWEGLDLGPNDHGETATIGLDGEIVTGVRIGGPSDLFGASWSSTFRADVTALGLVAPGFNQVFVSGVDFTRYPNGAGLVVSYQLGSGSGTVLIKDGNDIASAVKAPPYNNTAPVVFDFAPSSEARTVDLSMFYSGFFPDAASVITIAVDDVVVGSLLDVIDHADGAAWATVPAQVVIPAGATQLSVQAAPIDTGVGPNADGGFQKFAWTCVGFALPAPVQSAGAGCTPGYWKNHLHRWDGLCNDDKTSTVKWWLPFNCAFNVSASKSGLPQLANLAVAVNLKGGQVNALNRHAAAALANADAKIGYPYTKAQVIALYRDAVGEVKGPETIESAKDKLEQANELGCPCN